MITINWQALLVRLPTGSATATLVSKMMRGLHFAGLLKTCVWEIENIKYFFPANTMASLEAIIRPLLEVLSVASLNAP